MLLPGRSGGKYPGRKGDGDGRVLLRPWGRGPLEKGTGGNPVIPAQKKLHTFQYGALFLRIFGFSKRVEG